MSDSKTRKHKDYKTIGCPFCGSEIIQSMNCGKRYWFSCAVCESEGPTLDTRVEALEKWNKRAIITNIEKEN